ncbi:TPRXL protein [Cucumis melo var. makuwa]|uniref:Uncharacterized protein n=2 Tax=Cucumis melo TaxID=3656 RepID=A0A1S3B4I5_CUCME|nr:uncharacterized protein LOC103485682 [Cucumis melo]TYK18670.1 TPRXL protein [Cucumis melo var. makuwa]
MGSCISKCKPKMMRQPPLFDFNNLVQDKLVVIPQPLSPLLTSTATKTTSATPSLSLHNKISPYPPSPSPSSSSISSFTCLSSNTSSSTNTSFSTASSSPSPISSHHYFPSPYNQNPHLFRINSLKAHAFRSPVKPISPLVVRHPSPQRVSRSTPQKRLRPASPSPIRQKSFRKEVLQRPLSSPSPTRRFSREKCQVALAPINGVRPKSRSPVRGSAMKKEITCIHRISSKIDDVAVKEAVGDLDSVVAMEDMDNPLISLDCFIFL